MELLSIKERAILYRKQGYSYNMISERLGLSKSTISNWLKEVPYKPNKEVLQRIKMAPVKSGEIMHNRRVINIAQIKKIAKIELGILTKRDWWLLGIGLYLGEGSKLYETIRIINSDPQIIRIAIKWFQKICDLPIKNFSPSVHLYPDNNIKNTIKYWSKITNIPENQFKKTQVDRRNNKSKKKNRKLPFGTLHLQINSCGNKNFGRNLHRRIMGWIDGTTKQI